MIRQYQRVNIDMVASLRTAGLSWSKIAARMGFRVDVVREAAIFAWMDAGEPFYDGPVTRPPSWQIARHELGFDPPHPPLSQEQIDAIARRRDEIDHCHQWDVSLAQGRARDRWLATIGIEDKRDVL